MERDVILNLLGNNAELTSEQKNIIDAIEEANMEMNKAREIFELVSEPKLVDYAIYMEEAAKARLAYLLDQARKYGIKVDSNYTVKRASVV
jgi:hypothetical protein